jgi:selenocysteine lyase/cysteine desulfurase
MGLSRRDMMRGVGGLSVAGLLGETAAVSKVATSASLPPAATSSPISLPDRANYIFEGIHLNAAYTHPVGLRAGQASQRYLHSRMAEPDHNWPVQNARDDAVKLYARLINADPSEIAVVPSTLEGENLVAATLGLGPGRGVVSDSLHYDAALVMYGERAKQGMPFKVVAPRENRIDYDELARAITPDIKLVAISHVASATSYKHDLKRVCEVAHAKGALVYADVIQSVGGIPLDVKESGVDFCCAGMYKWLQGDFGTAFLYVRGDLLAEVKRTQVGWRSFTSYQGHFLPWQPPGRPAGEWEMGKDIASTFEVSTTNWGGLATTAGALEYLLEIGIDRIAAYRAPLLQQIREELVKAGWSSLTPATNQGPSICLALDGAGKRFGDALKAAKIYTTVGANYVRISPSLHNSMADIEALLAILTRRA